MIIVARQIRTNKRLLPFVFKFHHGRTREIFFLIGFVKAKQSAVEAKEFSFAVQ